MPDWMQQAKFRLHHVPDFAFSDAKRLDVNLAFRTLGKRAVNSDNVVLMLHGTTGSGTQFLQPESANALFAPGQPLDAERYFMILPDAIGHGASSKPSDRLGEAFPRYGYVDMVEAQYRLLVEGLNVKHLRLVIGIASPYGIIRLTELAPATRSVGHEDLGSVPFTLCLCALFGWVDATGFLHGVVFESFMSGNTTTLGLIMLGAHWNETVTIGIVLLVFVAGVILGKRSGARAYNKD